jgi:hypothetical protein
VRPQYVELPDLPLARSTAMASAMTASMFDRGLGLSIRQPRRE